MCASTLSIASRSLLSASTTSDNQWEQIMRRPSRDRSPICHDDSDTKRIRMSKKRVSFNESVTVRKIMILKEYTEEEIFATWFQKEEFETIKQTIIMLVRKVERDGAHIGPNRKYCVRGLESLMSEQGKTKRQARLNVTTAVLCGQDTENLDNQTELDDEAIASAARNASADSQLVAIMAGHRDQKEAMKVYRS